MNYTSNFESYFKKFKSGRWHKMNARCINGKFNPAHLTPSHLSYHKKGIKLCVTRRQFNMWCNRRKATVYGYWIKQVIPSIDRINSNGNYKLSNMRIISWLENMRRAAIKQTKRAKLRRQRYMMHLIKYCCACGKKLKLNSKESIPSYKKRVSCNHACNIVLQNRNRAFCNLVLTP